ncbi:zygote arrest protein 1 isoform X2 [Erinaceus europaeus]|uniref:Zygote arrest protein 1 isoform X2 n=1 Tax=Erinaceus europaeus TaxID=9365 RepID=A0ABM3X5G6_ERIEU|nr:zygote arrest protein 1 isoform X2 [Erinaceus europaeus]
MAALSDELLDGYMYPACPPYSYPFPYLPGAKGVAGGGGWRPREGGCPPGSSPAGAAALSLPGYGQLTAAEYSYQRAQLMALLSQVSPAPRPRRANSRDAAVQVNPRRDVAVQCSLGRRTLPRRARDPAPPAGRIPEGAASPPSARGAPEQSSSAGGRRPVRFPRFVAVYSPVAARPLTTFLEGAGAEAGERRPGAPGDEREASPSRPRAPEEGEVAAGTEESGAQAAAQESRELPTDGPGLPPREAPDHPQPGGKAEDAAGEQPSTESPEVDKERLRFQFLEQKYGYYHCKDCNIRWESAYVWCVQGTNKVYFKQFCRSCQKSYNPYRVEDITCQRHQSTTPPSMILGVQTGIHACSFPL